MKQEIPVRVEFLRACQKIAPNCDIRYYLNGVMIEVAPEETRYVATDGHRIICFRDREAKGEPMKIIVGHEAIDALPAASREPLAMTCDPDKPRGECRIGNVLFVPVEGKFPEYRKVLPETATKEWGHIQVRYMMSFQKAIEIAWPNRSLLAEFWPNGPDAVCLVTCAEPDFMGGVMPFRPTGQPGFVAAWAREEPQAVAA